MTPPGNRAQPSLAATEARQTTGALALDQGTQALVDQGGPPFHSSDPACLLEQLVIQIDSGSHDTNLL
jgi:hypothetical protein